jgi:2,4-dichlorophenol 6-monooxygenase
MASPINVPVLIIGGGGCGLNLSIFLSDLKVEHYLFERHSGTSILPKAHVLNQRTMEIFRQHGMDEDITGPGCPPQNMEEVIWQTTLGGDGPYDRKILGSVPCFGGGYDKERFQ